MGDLNAVHGTEQSTAVSVTTSATDTELVEEPKYVSLDTTDTSIVLPDESQYIVVTKIAYSVLAQICSFFLHGGENPTPTQVGAKVTGAANTSDVLDVHLAFPPGAPVKMSSTITVVGTLQGSLEYHIKQTQTRIPTRQAYA